MEQSTSPSAVGNGLQRPHHRVLKPPGGGSHDIFGTAQRETLPDECPRKGPQNSQKVNVCSEEDGVIPSAPHAAGCPSIHNKESMDQILKGEKEKEVVDGSPRKVQDHLKSSVFGDVEAQTFVPHGPARRSLGGGNPITGEGYKNGNPDNTENVPKNTRGRAPAHSTNLW